MRTQHRATSLPGSRPHVGVTRRHVDLLRVSSALCRRAV
ncbi:putative leader peptide [Streptantibioticus parmotrematis]